jgi:hypothetical protein
MAELPCTEEEIDAFIAAFEDGTLPKTRWTHGAHLLTGACYVHALGETAAADRMRMCVVRYNVAVGGENTETGGYHETITVAWIKLLARLLRESGPMERVHFTRLAVKRFVQERDIFSRYYDFDVVASKEARREWVPPTLLSLD